MNKNLYDRKAKLPKSLIKHLEECGGMVEADSNTEGFNRNKDAPFILNGGDRMNKWCNHVLDHWRSVDQGGKKRKMDGGMENQFIDNHAKDGMVVNPHDKHEKGINKFDTTIQESITKRFNRLI